MAYDALHRQVVLFGGTGGSGASNDTWVYDGTSWAQKSPTTSPSARTGAAMAYDAARGTVVLFGGVKASDGTFLNETWTWDGTNWTLQAPATSPSLRTNATVAFDAVHGYVLLFGGKNSTVSLADTWQWTGSNWSQFSPTTSPTARDAGALAAYPVSGTVVLFGGETTAGVALGDTWVWDGTNWTAAAPVSSPSARTYPSIALDTSIGQPVLYSGVNLVSSALGDTWSWNGSNWIQQTLTTSPTVGGAGLAFDEATNELIVFGGYAADGTTLKSDTWGLQLGSINLGSVSAGSASAAKVLTFVATGAGNTTFNTASPARAMTQGVLGKDFTSPATTCTASLASGSTCTATVQMTPAVAGARLGTLAIIAGDGSYLASVPLSGNGTGPQAVVYPGTQATLTNGAPATVNALAVDPNGALYAATGSGVAKLTVSGTTVTATAIGSLPSATSIAISGAGDLFVTSGTTLYKETFNGAGYTQSAVTATAVSGQGIAVDAAGNVYVINGTTVLRETPNGSGYTESTVLTGLTSPTGLAVDGAGNLYIGSGANVVKATAKGGGAYAISTIVTGLSTVAQIAADGSGDLYIADSAANTVVLATLSGGVYTARNIIAGAAGTAVAVDGSGNVYQGGAGTLITLDVNSTQTFSFPNTAVSSTGAPQTATLVNIGNATLTLPPPGTGNNPSLSANFSLSSSSTCPQLSSSSSAASLAAGSSCTDIISFAPTTAATINGSLVYTDNSLNGAPATQTVNLTGTGTQTTSKLAYGTAPAANVTAGGNAGSAITVVEQDSFGNTVSAATDSITLTVTYPDSTTHVYNATASSGVATFDLSSAALTQAGSYNYVASLTGVTSASAQEALVAQTQTTIAPTSSSLVNTSVTYTATVSTTGGATGTPTGNVIFSAPGQTSQTVALSNGQAQASFSFLSGGSFNVTAAFQGSTYYAASSTSTIQLIKQAYTYLVTTLADDATGNASNCVAGATNAGGGNANCSLRDAIAASNAVGVGGTSIGTTINFLASLAGAPASIIITTGGTLTITQPVTINGLGANALQISGNNSAAIMTLSADTTVSGLRFYNGKSTTVGGAITVTGGALTLNRDYFIQNTGGSGGAVSTAAAAGLLTVTGSTFSSNSASATAGAIYTASGSGGLSVANSTFAGNSSASGAGAVSFSGNTGTVINSTFSNNTSADTTSAAEGALSAHSALQVSNSIVSDNSTAGASGGGITSVGGATINASYDVFNNNTANGAAANCVGCTLSNSVTADPKLSAISNYGGPLPTMVPKPGSAAICAASVSASTNPGAASNQAILDERGVAHSSAYCFSTQLDAGAVQTNFTIGFNQNPSAQVSSGVPLVPAPSVTVQENTLSVFDALVTISLATGTPSGTATSNTTSSGLATFSNLIVPSGLTSDTMIATLSLNATTSTLITATSTSFSSLAVAPATLPAGTVGVAYSQTLSVSNGTGPYTYATNGALPAGVTLVTSGANAGRISGTATQGGTFNVTITATDSNSHTAAQAYALVIAAPTIVVSGTIPTLTYNSAIAATNITASGGTSPYQYVVVTAGTLPAGLSLSTAGVLTGTPTAAGAYSFTVRATDSSTGTGPYSGTITFTGTVQKAAATVTLASLTQTYTGSPLSATATTNPSGLNVVFTYNGSTTAPTNAGTYTLVGTINEANYQGSATANFTILKAAATVTLANLTQTYTGSPLSATATTSPAGLTVVFTYNGSSTVPTNAGIYTVVGTVSDNNYQGSASGSFTINKAVAQVVLSNLTQTYTGSPLSATATTTPTGLRVDLTYNGSAAAPTNAGTYAVVGTVNESNYTGTVSGTLVINKAVAPITLGNLTPTYTGTPIAATAKTVPTGLTVTLTYNGSATVPTAAGSYAVVATVVDNNYQGTNTATMVINKATLTITAPTLTKVYGADLPTLTGTYSGNVNNEAFTVTVTTTATKSSPVVLGGYPITPTVTGATLSNYNVVQVLGKLTVTPATLTITAPTLSKAYGAVLPSLNGTYSGNVNGDTFTVTGVTSATASSPVVAGGYVITPTVTGTNLSSYNVVAVNGTLTITPVGLTVTAPSISKAYGAALPSLNGTYTGNVGNDTFTVTGTTNATASSAVGTYTITPTATGANMSSYTVTYVTGTLTVTPATLTITGPTVNKAYGAALPSLNGTYTGNVNGDTFNVTGTTTATAASPVVVGGYTITPVVTGANISNYSVVAVPGVLNITPVTLTITAPTVSKVYGAPMPSLNGTYSGNVNGDTFTITGSTVATASSPVLAGGYAITPVAAGINLSSYNVVTMPGLLTITPAALTVTAPNVSKAYGADMPSLNGTYTGNVNGDVFTVSGTTTATVSSPVKAGGYPITPTVTGTNLASYTVTYVPGVLTVTPVALTVTGPTLTKTYGAAVPSLNGTYSGNLSGDTFTVTGTTTATASSSVGNYAVTPAVTGANLSNYTVVTVPGKLTIAPANLTVTVAPATKVFATPNPTVTGTLTGVVAGDGITATYSTTATTNSPVGAYPITATLVDPNGKLGNYTVTNTPNTLTITPITPTISFTAIPAAVLLGDSVTLTATVTSPAGLATGKVNFIDGAVLIGSATLNSSGVGAISISTLVAGSHTLTAVYVGDSNFVTVTSAPTTVLVQDFTLNIANGTLPSQTAPLGGTATYAFALTPSAATFPLAVTFSVSGLPAGATATFSPTSLAAGSSATNVTLSVKLPSTLAQNRPGLPFNPVAPLSLALLALPFAAWKRRKLFGATRLLGIFLLLFAGISAALSVTGCATGNSSGSGGGGGGTSRSFTLTVTATQGTLSRSTTTTLNVQ